VNTRTPIVGEISIANALERLRALEGRGVELGVRALEDAFEIGPLLVAVGTLSVSTGGAQSVFGGDALVIGLNRFSDDALSISCRGEALMRADVGRYEGSPVEHLRLTIGGLEVTVISRLDGEPFDPREGAV
jgi:hypothetical protein